MEWERTRPGALPMVPDICTQRSLQPAHRGRSTTLRSHWCALEDCFGPFFVGHTGFWPGTGSCDESGARWLCTNSQPTHFLHDKLLRQRPARVQPHRQVPMYQARPKQDPPCSSHYHGGGAAVMTRDSDGNTSSTIAQVLTLHVPVVSACFAPGCAYLALVCAVVSLFVLDHNTCLRVRVLCLRGPFVRASPAPASTCSPCTCVCTLSFIWSTCSFVVSSQPHR